jgi:hypothetical protein
MLKERHTKELLDLDVNQRDNNPGRRSETKTGPGGNVANYSTKRGRLAEAIKFAGCSIYHRPYHKSGDLGSGSVNIRPASDGAMHWSSCQRSDANKRR